MYWLKPFDAVNDTANAVALLRFDWSKEPIMEAGGGDGVFSFIMHGGAFAFTDDRYNQADPGKSGDIYDVYDRTQKLHIKKTASIFYNLGADLKISHIYKARETGMYRNNQILSAIPETLPVKSGVYSTVFLYTFHGLSDYRRSLAEIRRIIRSDGVLLAIVVNDTVKNNFICFKLSRFFARQGWHRISRYFAQLDGGRHDEIAGLFAKNWIEWVSLLQETGFAIEEVYSQVSPALWKIYDTQTRPLLKYMIHCSRFLSKVHLKTLVKFLWICMWLPILMISYLLMALPIRLKMDGIPQNVFIAIKAKPV